MSQHLACIRWIRRGPDFLDRRYSRSHTWYFDGGAVVAASSSPSVVPVPWSSPEAVDPEEAFVASVSSCHMLWFLHLACDAGFTAEQYVDEAVGTMSKNSEGTPWISQIVLRPAVVWGGDARPTESQIQELHHDAHRRCFIAASIRTEVNVEPV